MSLCKVYTPEDLYRPFTVSLFCGHGKPNDPTDYLKNLVTEMNVLFQTGIDINNRHFTLKIKFFVCDSHARSFLKSVVGHVAFKGCERCAVRGEKVDSVTVFQDTGAEKKTDADFISLRTRSSIQDLHFRS